MEILSAELNSWGAEVSVWGVALNFCCFCCFLVRQTLTYKPVSTNALAIRPLLHFAGTPSRYTFWFVLISVCVLRMKASLQCLKEQIGCTTMAFWLESSALSDETPHLHQSAFEPPTRECESLSGSSDGPYLLMEIDSGSSGSPPPPSPHSTPVLSAWPHHFSPWLNVLVLSSEAAGWVVTCLLTPSTPLLSSSFCQRKHLPPCRLLFWQLGEERWKVLILCRKLFCIQIVSLLSLPYRQWFCCVVAKG